MCSLALAAALSYKRKENQRKIEAVLRRLAGKGARASLRKPFFAQKEIGYLGCLLASDGLQPLPKKVEAMKQRRLAAPGAQELLLEGASLAMMEKPRCARRQCGGQRVVAPHEHRFLCRAAVAAALRGVRAAAGSIARRAPSQLRLGC